MPNQAHHKKHFAGRFRLSEQPNGVMQNHSMLRPATVAFDFFYIPSVLSVYSEHIAIKSVQRKIWSTLNSMRQENAPLLKCVE